MAAHTNTGEWQSFELRMRRRRAERLLLRADAAADAGFFDEAREALAEARRLEPALPDVGRIEGRLRDLPPEGRSLGKANGTHDKETRVASAVLVAANARVASTTPAHVTSATPTHVASAFRRKAAAIALVALSAAIGYFLVRGEPALEPTHEFYAAVPAVEAPDPSAPLPSASAPGADPRPVSTTGTDEAPNSAAADTVREPAAPATPPVVPASLRKATPPADSSSSTPPTVERPDARSIADPIEPSAPRVSGAPGALPAAPAPAIPTAPPAASSSLAAAVSAPAIPPAADPIAMQTAVRTVLDRYAAAYSDLDADAAQRVWPGVNRDGLARAFSGLASQRVSLGSCSIDVAGARARARCAGSSTWRPKVGDAAARTDARTWTFELARAGADWTITSARVQNR
jgi:hypothetical protein